MMQYFKPADPFYVGDCMPFFYDGVFHLYYLQDENHHQAKGGLGGHQWAHAASKDLIHWEHFPLAIRCTEDWEGSICTGSTIYHEGTFYAYYATRTTDRTEKLSMAKSKNGITFEKCEPNPFASPEAGYLPKDYRDPFVFADETTGQFHMLVTASLANYPLYGRGGCLLRLTSLDLEHWQVTEPFLIPGGIPGYPCIPECPDYFHWNGWYYLVFGLDGKAHYRVSKQPMGPWFRLPVDTFDGSTLAVVMKTAAFTDNRRIGVAFLASRQGDKDNGQRMYAGHALFREIVQHEDGSLGTKFPREMVPAFGKTIDVPIIPLTKSASGSRNTVRLVAYEGQEVAMMDRVPRNIRIALTVRPEEKSAEFGLWLRGSGSFETGYSLQFLPYEHKVTLNQQWMACVTALDRPFTLEIIVKDDIIDVCVDQRRCLIDRCPEQSGERVFFYCQNGAVTLDSIEISALI